MLLQFNFKNYKSFRNEATLDLSATKMSELSEHVATIGKERILPAAVLFGANASGKSNVLAAFEFMSGYVDYSFDLGGDNVGLLTAPFLFDEASAMEDSEFEVYFTIPKDANERIFNYGFCFGSKGVSEEWLNVRSKTGKEFRKIFYRNQDDLDLKKIPKESRENIRVALEKQSLIISLGAKLKISICKEVRDWFVNNKFVNFGDAAFNYLRSKELPAGFIENQYVQKDVVKYLSSFDDSIRGFEVQRIPKEGEGKKDILVVHTLHREINSNKYIKLPLRDESSGTLKMFALYQDLQTVLNRGSVLIVDELNSRLHPLLVRNIMLSFLNPEINTKHAQLIFTSHDTWHLDNQMLRRDEIWFTEKNEDGISSLFSLSDIVSGKGEKIRKDENFEKNYLLGKYGAIPILERLLRPEET